MQSVPTFYGLMFAIALISLLLSSSTNETLLRLNHDQDTILYQNTPALVGEWCIWGWRNLISPYNGSSCRFTPSCSTYAYNAIRKRGLAMGIILAAARLARCNACASGGYPLSNGGEYCDPLESHW